METEALQLPDPNKLQDLLKRHSQNGKLGSALAVAVQRALHQVLDDPLIFDDPYALAIVGGLKSSCVQRHIPDCDTLSARYLRAFFSVRSRIVDDEQHAALRGGVKQVVICGAGLDTSQFRIKASQVKIFELDHPHTQSWKYEIARELGWISDTPCFHLPIDFSTDRILEVLQDSAFDASQRSFFSMIGLTPYLTRECLMQLFQDIRQLSPCGSKIVFDFVIDRNLLPPWKQAAHDNLAQRMTNLGLPWLSSFDPLKLCGDLEEIGYLAPIHIGSDLINKKYFPRRADQLRVGKLAHLIIAETSK